MLKKSLKKNINIVAYNDCSFCDNKYRECAEITIKYFIFFKKKKYICESCISRIFRNFDRSR